MITFFPIAVLLLTSQDLFSGPPTIMCSAHFSRAGLGPSGAVTRLLQIVFWGVLFQGSAQRGPGVREVGVETHTGDSQVQEGWDSTQLTYLGDI